MDITYNIIIVLLIVNFILLLFLIYFIKRTSKLTERLSKISFDKKSTEVKHGKAWEEFVPFLEDFPYRKENFKFIGNPIDGIAFEDDRIAFVEIKTGRSQMSSRQKEIRRLIENGNIEFKELRY